MNKTEFKEYLKTEVLKMTEATDDDIKNQKDLNAELEKTKEFMSTMMATAEGKDQKHYTKDGKEWTGKTHKMPDGTLMTQNPHNKDSEELSHEPPNKIKESKMKKSQFKEYLKNEILREMNEAEEEVDTEVDTEVDAEEEVIDEPEFGSDESTEGDISSISDDLVELAKKAKEAGEVELANQILNSAKFANKTKLKDVESEI
jgi:hypothetical protein